MKRLCTVAAKEFAHIYRDPTSLTIVMIMPVLLVLVFGYAINFDLDRVEVGVIDQCGGEHARTLIEAFQNNRYFHVRDLSLESDNPVGHGESLLKSGELHEYMVVPVDFSRNVAAGRKAEVGLVIDGSDSNVANLVYQYNERILLQLIGRFQDVNRALKVSTQIYFNPELKSALFFIPGMVAVLLLMISALLTSLSIAREKESGSIDLIFISPLRSWEIIVGKTVPYVFIALLVEASILIFAGFWFQVPFQGDPLILLLFSLLFITSGLSMGVLFSTVARSQSTAMFATLLATLLPSILLSGFIFPLESMGWFLRLISRFVPATYFLQIIRGVILKGAPIQTFWRQGVSLLAFSFVLLILSSVLFNQNRKPSR
jgi:ABC-2 type transport system permease protein